MQIRDWKLKEIAQGKPWAHPTHAMFVHFPTAFYPAALVFGVLSRVRPSSDHADVAALLVGGGLAATLPAALTGLLDWAGMVAGSTKRGVATKHMLYQLTATALAVAAFVALLIGGDGPASVLALATLGCAVAVVLTGNWFGGVLVYRMAMRVGGSTKR